jgi:ADP-heptose:LPS heptosyltransferase
MRRLRAALSAGLVTIGWRLLAPWQARRRRELARAGGSLRRILVLTPVLGVGNFVLLSGLLANLRRLYPGAHLTLAAPAARHAATLLGPELVDEIVPFDAESWGRGLRGRGYDLGLATFFLPPLRASLCLLRAGCRFRVAFAPDERWGMLNTVTCRDRNGHELDRHLELLAFASVPLERTLRLRPSGDDDAWASAVLERVGATRRLVGLHPGCEPVNAQKRWPAERFGEVARRLLTDPTTAVLVFLGPGEEDVLPALALPDTPRLVVVRGEPLAHVIALVARCGAFVSNDSGLMHVAAALGVPVVALFGPTPLEKNAPLGRATVLEVPGLWCRPCWIGPPLTCHRERRYCLEGITVDAVVAAARASCEPPQAARGAVGTS